MLFRVVITGLGFISVLGQNKLEVAKRLHAMDSGIVYDKSRLDHGFSSPLTGAISYFDPSLYLTRKQRRSMPDFVLWAYAATEKALNDADLEPKDLQNERTGL
ncbi:MAG: beta-ketoacyl-[Desulfovibrio sp.]|nr:beta-ketoacyl-[acyl-carrier-protein] synthase family protein [Desulfovibrio sp.]